MEHLETKKRLFAIGEMINEFLNTNPSILVGTHSFLQELQKTALGIEEENTPLKLNTVFDNFIKIYCGSFHTGEPYEATSISYLIDFNDPKQSDINSVRFVKPGTADEGEYDSIYFSLQTLFDLSSGINISKPITIISSNLLVIQQLNGEIECKKEKIINKRNLILELAQQITNTSVIFLWKPSDISSNLKEVKSMARNSMESLLTEENHEIKGTKKP